MSDTILAALIGGGCALLVPLVSGVVKILIGLWEESHEKKRRERMDAPTDKVVPKNGLSKISMLAGVAGFILAVWGASVFTFQNIERCEDAENYQASLHTQKNAKDVASKLRTRGFNVDVDQQVLSDACRVEYFSEESHSVASCAAHAVSSWCRGDVEVKFVGLRSPQPRRLGVWVK